MTETLPQSPRRVMIESMSFSKLPDYRFMGVYYIQNCASNKFYVGSSFDVYSRIKSHLNLLQRNCHTNIHMQRSYNKHGQDKFAWGTCEEVFDIDQLLVVEQLWIDVMGDYNICTEAGSTRGYVATEEARAKMSAARLGPKNPMYGTKRPEISEIFRRLHTGRVLSEEHKRKCSEALKGKRGPWDNPESAAKIIEAARVANTGRKHSEETRAKVSAAGMGRVVSEETREKLRNNATGVHHTDETKAKLSYMKKGKKLNLSDDERARRSARAKAIRSKMTDEQKADVAKRNSERCAGVPLSDEHKAKIAEATRGKVVSESALENMRAAAKSRRPLTEEQIKAKSETLQRVVARMSPEQKAAAQIKRVESLKRNKAAKLCG